MLDLVEIKDTPELLPELRAVLMEYGFYMYNQLSLTDGKERFMTELETLPGANYQSPSGTFILAIYKEKIAGCVGIKKFTTNECEMKRMYIRPEFREKGIGGLLFDYVIKWSKTMGYKKILLDTNEEMKEAVKLYLKKGFIKIPAYCINENDHPVFMEYSL